MSLAVSRCHSTTSAFCLPRFDWRHIHLHLLAADNDHALRSAL
ncbi:hypothetical protein QA641_27210 [Bradyrhizobium sp. CB1650]|nr:hypothetical protein [Bradyrhizobium sp. CB1650]WGD49318.1 hypothetical protein QA641_27210 [Bradyrhizobium sp. CB1650]